MEPFARSSYRSDFSSRHIVYAEKQLTDKGVTMTRRTALMIATGACLFMVLSGCTATDPPNQTEYTATGTVMIEGSSLRPSLPGTSMHSC